MRKIEIRNYNQFECVTSHEWGVIILKLNKLSLGLEDLSEFIKEKLGVDFLRQSGVYFLRLKDGYYIGETRDLIIRFADHIEKREVESITLATYKSVLDKFDKEMIRDLESLLISHAENTGIQFGEKLKNIKQENRKTSNLFASAENEELAKYMWDKFLYLNLDNIIEDLRTRNIEKDEHPGCLTAFHSNETVDFENQKLERKGPVTLEKTWEKKNVIDHKIDLHSEIFDYVPQRTNLATAYTTYNGDMFLKEYIVECLFEYLYTGKGNKPIDISLTNGKRDRGWITAMTLAYFRIETNGNARGILRKQMSAEKSKQMISKFVSDNY